MGGEDIPTLGTSMPGGKGSDGGAGSCRTVLLGPVGLWPLSLQPGAWQGGGWVVGLCLAPGLRLEWGILPGLAGC